jgi:hypothetical protein
VAQLIVSGKLLYINETADKICLGGSLMGTGRKPASASQTTVTVRATKKESAQGTEASSAGQNRQQQQSPPCWHFRLENPVSKAIQKVTVGTSIQGQPVGSRILVSASQVGELGSAPEGISRRIIKAQQNNGGGLGGSVVEHHRTTVKVKLCIQ